MRAILMSCVLATVVGCASRGPTPVPAPAPPTLPGPSSFRTSAVLTGEQFGLDGRLMAEIRAEAISARPLRSRYRGEMLLVLNQDGRRLLDMETVIEGEYDGSPTGGIVEALNRLMNAISLAARPAEKLTGPHTRPADEPGGRR